MARNDKSPKLDSTPTEDTPRARKASARPIVEAPPKKPLFERVAGWLDGAEWRYDEFPEKQYFSLACRLQEAIVRVIVDTAEAEAWERILVLVSYPVRIAESKRIAVLERLAKINYGLVFGSFDMDLSDGEVRFRATVEADHPLTDAMVGRVFNNSLSVADNHFEELMRVAYGEPAAGDAVAIKPVNAPGSEVLQ